MLILFVIPCMQLFVVLTLCVAPIFSFEKKEEEVETDHVSVPLHGDGYRLLGQ